MSMRLRSRARSTLEPCDDRQSVISIVTAWRRMAARISAFAVQSSVGRLATDAKLPEAVVRRAKVRIIPWVRDPPGNSVVPAGKQPSGRGGNESVEALASEIAHGG